MSHTVPYVLFSAARNEEDHIEKTLRSVVSQTSLPSRWVVVSDGSTDRTDAIIQDYAAEHPFVDFVRRETGAGRDFGSKVHAIRHGLKRLEGLEYAYMGNLDADVSFSADYFQQLLTAFETNPRLGIGGGIVYDAIGDEWVRQYTTREWSVAGAVQMFRRECFEQIGGYLPLDLGGIDTVAEIMARMNGWEVTALEELQVRHHQLMGTKKGGVLGARFRQGKMEYAHGYHPLFELGRCFLRFRERPYVLGSLYRLTGYWQSALRRAPRDLPEEVVAFLRKEQMGRMRAMMGGGGS